jgi:hypothetical protein
MVIITIIGILSLLALISYRLGTDDGGRWIPEQDREILFWTNFGRR